MPFGCFAFCRAAESVRLLAVVTFLAISSWLSAAETSWAQQEGAPVHTEVIVYGEESAIVDAMTKESHAQDTHKYPNELDHVFSVLLNRAYPKPEPQDLARPVIDAICNEVDATAEPETTDSRRSAWAAAATRTKSFESVLNDLEARAAGHITRTQLVNTGLTAMLRATGCKYAGVLSEADSQWMMNIFAARDAPGKERGTIGVDVSRWPAIHVVPGMPAAKAGLRDGDVVLRVGTRDVAKTEVAADGLKALGGAAGTAISLTVKRGSNILRFEVRRASAAERVNARVIEPGVVYIPIPQFEGAGIAERVKQLVRKFVTDATSDVILDLRNNIGGRPEEANGVADIFLDEKCLQIYEFSNGRRIAFKSKPGALQPRVILLVNRATGCAAETLVIALHDNHRGVVVGRPTAGVLSGHDGEKLRDGRLVIFRSEPTVLSPTGNDYSETGVSPDILVDAPNSPGEDKILERALQLARARCGEASEEGE
jgi:C-terminal peptidase prc